MNDELLPFLLNGTLKGSFHLHNSCTGNWCTLGKKTGGLVGKNIGGFVGFLFRRPPRGISVVGICTGRLYKSFSMQVNNQSVIIHGFV